MKLKFHLCVKTVKACQSLPRWHRLDSCKIAKTHGRLTGSEIWANFLVAVGSPPNWR